jgi:PAS domain S-box-containing protein
MEDKAQQQRPEELAQLPPPMAESKPAPLFTSETNKETEYVGFAAAPIWLEQTPSESEKRYKRLLESVTDYIYTVKVEDGRVVATRHGAGCMAVTGYSPQEYEANPYLWYDMIHTEDRSAVLEQAARALAGEVVPPLEHRIIHKNGFIRWVKNTPVLQYDEANRFVGYDSLIADITERRQAEDALRESEARFRTLAETTAAAIFIFQDKLNCYVNPATQAITGYSREELLSMNFWDVVHPDFRELIKKRGLARQRGEPVPSHYVVKILTKDGQERWLDFTGGLIEFQGKPAVLGTAFDVTERKRVEAEIKQRNTELVTLQYAGATIAASLDVQLVLNTFTREMVDLLGVEGCAISEWDWAADTVSLIAEYGLPGWWDKSAPTKVYHLADFPLTKRVLLERRPQQLTINQPGVDPAELAYMRDINIDTLLMLPMESQDHIVGLIEIMDGRVERIFTNEEIRLAQVLANQAASAIDNAHLYAETQQRLKEQIALQKATIAISSTLDLSTVLNHIAKQMGQAVDATSTYICSCEPETMTSRVLVEYFSPSASSQERISDLGFTYPLPRDFSATFDRLLAGQPEIIHLDNPGMTESRRGHMECYGVQTILNIPLQVGGQVIAFAELWESRHRREFTMQEIALCQGIAQQAAIALENARLYDQAQQEIAERKKIEQELRQSEARHRALLDAIPDLMFRVTREGQYLNLHGGKEWSLDLPDEAYIGQNLTSVLPAEIANLILDYIHKVLDSGAVQTFEYRLPLLLTFQDYEIRLVASGPNEVLVLVRNITERKRMEEQAIQGERLAALGRLSAALTHEINNPLQSIQSHLDLMLDFPLEPGEDKKFLRIMRQEIERLHNITRRILNFARPQSASRQKTSVTELLEEVLILAGKQLQQHYIQIITDWRDVPPVLAAPGQLTQVFLNLLINAIEVIPPNGKLHIAVYREGDAEVAISFTNSGPTIPPETLPHIFEPFFTTKPEGSGLGLWVSHSLVQQHGGSLIAENLGSDQGVVFTVNLPAAPREGVEDGRSNAGTH